MEDETVKVPAARRGRPKKDTTPEPVQQTAPDPAPQAPTPLFDVEEAPKGILDGDGAMDKVFKKLGLKGNEPSEPTKAISIPQAKLNKAQQSVIDGLSPLAVSLFVFVMGWAWTQAGPEYAGLAPDEEVATKIVAPLVRIYARTSKLTTTINPNTTDALASLTALIAYAWTSVSLFQQIKQEKGQSYESVQEPQPYQPVPNPQPQFVRRAPDPRPELRQRPLDTDESGDGGKNYRRNGARASGANYGANPEGNGGAGDFNVGNLTESQRYAYEKLSRLRELDFASRARRSGLPG